MDKKKLFVFLLLHIALFIYSLEIIVSKLASNENFLSFGYLFYLFLIVVVLGVYAILWQQALKYMNLTFAYANKGITLIWGTLIGFFLFHESVSFNNILGIIVILIGIVIMIIGEKNHG